MNYDKPDHLNYIDFAIYAARATYEIASREEKLRDEINESKSGRKCAKSLLYTACEYVECAASLMTDAYTNLIKAQGLIDNANDLTCDKGKL